MHLKGDRSGAAAQVLCHKAAFPQQRPMAQVNAVKEPQGKDDFLVCHNDCPDEMENWNSFFCFGSSL
jgi:hypothetical protein